MPWLAVAAPPRSLPADAVVARVDGTALLLSQIVERLPADAREHDAPPMSETWLARDAVRRALTDLVDETLLVDEARRREIEPNEMEVTRRVDELIQALTEEFGSREALEAHLDASGQSFDALRGLWLARERRRAMTTQLVLRRVRVDAAAVEAFKAERATEGRPAEEVHLAQILIAPSSPPDAARVQALRVAREAAAHPERFHELAAQANEDAALRASGGDLGWLDSEQLVAPLREAVGGMAVGDVSDPVATPRGWHVLLLVGRHTARDLLFAREFERQRTQLATQLRTDAVIELFDLDGRRLATTTPWAGRDGPDRSD